MSEKNHDNQEYPEVINGIKRGEAPIKTEGTAKNRITHYDQKDEKVKLGMLWTQTSKAEEKWWKGKFPLSTMLRGLVEFGKLGLNRLPEDTCNAMETLAETLDRDKVADLDLLMWANKYRQKGKNHPHLNVFAQISAGYEEVNDEDMPD